MENYEKSIGLKTIWLTLARRWKLILVIFIPIAIGAFLVTNFMVKKTYVSSISIDRQATIIQTIYNNVVSDTKSSEVINAVVDSLKANEKKHSNGAEITFLEISSGLSESTFNSTSNNITFYFQSSDSTITKDVLQTLAEIAVNKIKSRGGDYSNFKVADSGASAPVKNSKERSYFFIALAADLVLALGIPFVQEILDDEVYDKKDIEMLGSEGFELSTTGASSNSEDK